MSSQSRDAAAASENPLNSKAMVGGLGIPALLTALASFCLISGCSGEATAQNPGQSQPIPVPVVKVEPKDLPLSWEYPAQISGLREVEIRARVSGIIEKRGFEEGARVREGQSLYKLDDAPYQTALLKALADEKAAEVRLKQAQRDLDRIRPLLDSKAVSQLEVDNAQSAAELADANLSVARARVREARLNVTYSKVESPVTGYVSRSLKDEGSLISGPTELLTTVTQVDEVYANFGIPEKDHRSMNAGSLKLPPNGKLKVVLLDNTGEPMGFDSSLAFQDVRVNPSTGTVDARAKLNNKNEKLNPGQFVRVRLTGAVQPDAITLPQRAVIQSPMGGKIVMTVTPDNKVAPRPVQVAQWEGDQWVITSGLQAGDLVMTDGYMKAQPGSAVSPMIDGKPLKPQAEQTEQTGSGQTDAPAK
ncbi:MAG: efflux RND transporter periplasmic adaptor subunit [Limnobacter sp.]|nr:efflux RND transporter periplasmic adaptor subunit [Limnobacter sp.]